VRFATPDLYQASIKGYYGLISGIDSAIGSMRETLATLGLADNTIIIYSADHGIFNGEHGLAGKWYGHEESIRIPLIIHDPRLPENLRGKRRQAMTLNIDLNPTITQMAGLKTPEPTQGRSLVKLLQDDQRDNRPLWFFEHHFPNGGWIPSSEGIRTQRWKYIRYTDDASPYEELYDLEQDKFETNNLINHPHYAHQHAVLAAYWQTWRNSLHTNTASWIEPVEGKDLRRDGLE
jgi:arylsulfatase A-like enzyme